MRKYVIALSVAFCCGYWGILCGTVYGNIFDLLRTISKTPSSGVNNPSGNDDRYDEKAGGDSDTEAQALGQTLPKIHVDPTRDIQNATLAALNAQNKWSKKNYDLNRQVLLNSVTVDVPFEIQKGLWDGLAWSIIAPLLACTATLIKQKPSTPTKQKKKKLTA